VALRLDGAPLGRDDFAMAYLVKLIAILCAGAPPLVLGSPSAYAQASYATVVPPEAGQPAPPPAIEGFRMMQIGGGLLFASGGATFLLGLCLEVFQEVDRTCPGGCPLDGTQKAGIALLAAGGATALGGIPLWIVGARRRHEAEAVTMLPSLTPLDRGAAMRWTF
jgi:hypothetical protein